MAFVTILVTFLLQPYIADNQIIISISIENKSLDITKIFICISHISLFYIILKIIEIRTKNVIQKPC